MAGALLGCGVSSIWVAMNGLSSALTPGAGTELSAPGTEEPGGKAGAGCDCLGGGTEVEGQNAPSSACQ